MAFPPCPECQVGGLQVQTGYAAVPPDESTEVTELGDGWKSGSLNVVPTLIMWCAHCGWATAGQGLDHDGNTVMPEAGLEIHSFLTDPDLIIIDDDQIRGLLND